MFIYVYEWLSLRRKTPRASIEPSMSNGKPILSVSIGNYFGTKPILINRCHLTIDNHPSSATFSTHTVPLPYMLKVYEGASYSFDPVPLAISARENGKQSVKVRVLFQDNTGREYISRPITVPTDPKAFTRLFEDYKEYHSKSLGTVLVTAHDIADQFQQQYVGVPHIVLGLVRENDGVGGAVLRKLGLDENYVLNLAKDLPNSPRDHTFQLTHQLTEVHEVVGDFLSDEARKMHHKCQGTGHLLLALIEQKNEAFLGILQHLNMRPNQLRKQVYEELLKNRHQADHPVLPPQGIRRYVWAIRYQIAHSILMAFWSFIEWLYPDLEI